MNKKFTLSISAFILAGVLAGCSDDNKNEEPVKETKTALQGAESNTEDEVNKDSKENKSDNNPSKENSSTSEKEASNDELEEKSSEFFTSKDVEEGKVDLSDSKNAMSEGEKARAEKEEKEAQEADKKFQAVRDKIDEQIKKEQAAKEKELEEKLNSKNQKKVQEAKEDPDMKIEETYQKSKSKVEKTSPKSNTATVYNEIKKDYSKMLDIKYEELRKQIIQLKQKGIPTEELNARKERASLELGAITDEGFNQMDIIFNKAKNPTNYGSYARILQKKYIEYSDALERL